MTTADSPQTGQTTSTNPSVPDAANCTYWTHWPAAPDTWWQEATQRIDTMRKAPLRIEVTDGEGRPCADVEVDIRQTRSAFAWGSAVSERRLGATENNADLERYRQAIVELFPVVTLENGHKWRFWENPEHRALTERTVAWLQAQGIAIRGHTLIWQHKNRTWSLPDDVYDSSDATHIRQRIEQHLRDILGRYAGQFVEWDVVNEVWSEHVLTDKLSPTTSKELAPDLVRWFQLAKQLEPSARLYLNDYGIIESGGHENTEHQNSYDATISFLLQQQAPLEGIGIQGHFGAGPVPHGPVIWRILDRFARFGLPIRITEFDMFGKGWNEAAEEKFLHEFLTACFAHPAVDGILMWGFWDGCHWFDHAPLYRRDWSLKPSGRRYLDLVHQQWRTRERRRTNAAGVVEIRAFQGMHEVRVGNQKLTATVGAHGAILLVRI